MIWLGIEIDPNSFCPDKLLHKINCLFEVACFSICQATSHFHAVAVAQFDCSFPTSAISGLSLRKLDIDWWLTLLPLFNGVSLIKLDLWSFHNLFFTTQSLAS